MKIRVNNGIYYLFILFVFSMCFSCSNNKGYTSREEQEIYTRIQNDSIKKCEDKKKEAFEQIKRGNLILYRNFDDYVHASEYFYNKYDIILMPVNNWNVCAQQIMDSVIFQKFGKNILLIADDEIRNIYNGINDNLTINNYYAFAEELPEYPGGIDSLYSDIYKKVPKIDSCSIDAYFSREIKIKFVIDIYGNIKEVKVIQKLCPKIDKKIVLALLELKKKWKPAVHDEKKVPYQMTLSIDWK